MGMNGIIYKITNPKGKIYVGQTTNIKRRIKEYKRLYINKSQSKIFNSIIKYTWEEHILEIIEVCDVSIIDKQETYWIKHYNSVKNGLNITHGGKALARGRVKSEEWKNKIGEAHLGMKHSTETKLLMSNSNKGKNKGREVTWADKISLSKKGKTQSETHKLNRANSKKRKVLRTDVITKNIITFDSVIEAANSVGLKRGTIISECCKNKRQSYKNYKFKYE